jgi:hypothetical protein
MKEIHPNFVKTDCIDDLVSVKQDIVTCRGKMYESFFFFHQDFPGLISSAHCYVIVNQEGGPSEFWGMNVSNSHDAPATNNACTEESDSHTNQENIDISTLQSIVLRI